MVLVFNMLSLCHILILKVLVELGIRAWIIRLAFRGLIHEITVVLVVVYLQSKVMTHICCVTHL
jgi:hypothetical protein